MEPVYQQFSTLFNIFEYIRRQTDQKVIYIEKIKMLIKTAQKSLTNKKNTIIIL